MMVICLFQTWFVLLFHQIHHQNDLHIPTSMTSVVMFGTSTSQKNRKRNVVSQGFVCLRETLVELLRHKLAGAKV